MQCSSCYQPPRIVCLINHNPLSLTIQPFFYLSSCPSLTWIQAYNFKSLAEVKVNDILCSPVAYKSSHFITKGNQAGQA